MDLSKRNTALDITRIVAMLSVVSIHFFLNSGYYSEPMIGTKMLLLTILRTAFVFCVPLFIMLSGYLLNKKTLSGKYYLGIAKTLGIYVLASLACILYDASQHGTEYTPGKLVSSILDFSGAKYSWYIEMYIGLFLLIPFLNAMYNGLNSRRNKTVLIITMIVLTALPSVMNIYNFSVQGWFKTPNISYSYQQLVADWWVNIYPITYYLIGAYLKEYPIRIKKIYNLLLLGAAIGIFGVFNYYRSYGGCFVWGTYTDWYSLPTLIITVLVFTFLSVRDTSKFPNMVKRILASISDLCLGAYLTSYIFDDFLYAILRINVETVTDRANYFIPMVLAVAALSLLVSLVLNLIYKCFEKIVNIAICGVARKTKDQKDETVI